MKRTMIQVSLVVLLLPLATGCTFLSKCTDYNGLPGQHGKPVEFYSAVAVGMNLVFILPIVGDPTPAATLSALTAKVKDDGGSNVRVVSSGTTYLWYVYFPFSLIFTPVITSVSADAEFSGPSGVEKKTAVEAPQPRMQPASYQRRSGESPESGTPRRR